MEQEGERMNRLNHKLREVLTRYLKCKKIYYNSQNIEPELSKIELIRIAFNYHVATREAYKWCTIAETIRKGYKRAIE